MTVSLRSPRFLAYLGAQFLGAFNDSAFKMTMLLTMFAVVGEQGSDPSRQVALSSLATALFPIPYLLFSQSAGWLADRFPKHRVLLFAKAPEVLIMILGALALSASSRGGGFAPLFGVYFLMAMQSAFFSPAKYGILPEVLADRDLSQANGVLDMATNLAVLLGTIGGTVLYTAFRDAPGNAGWIFTAIAVAGVAAIAAAPRAAPGRPGARLVLDPVQVAREDWREVRAVPVLGYTILGIAYFAVLGSLLLTIVPVYGLDTLGLGETAAGGLLTLLAVGIATGAVLAGRLSQGRVELGLVPLGAAGVLVFCSDLAFFAGSGDWLVAGVPVRVAVDLAGLGISGGLFSVPLNALLQQRTPEDRKGRIIGFSNIISFTGVLGAAGLSWAITTIGDVDARSLLFGLALLTAIGSVYVMRLLPDFFVRLVVYLLMNTLYRVRVTGHENIPRGGALFVCNHVSWVDALIVTAASGRMVRFLMFRPYYEMPVFRRLFAAMHVIPVAGGDPPEKTQASLDQARDEIAAGHAVCIFAEGTITRTGQLLGFRGLEKIARNAQSPIVPVALDGLWGSLFSFEGGRFLLKRPRRFRHRIQVLFGEALPHDASAFEVRQAVEGLCADAPRTRDAGLPSLASELFRVARARWWQPFARDASASLGHGDAWIASRALRKRLFSDGRAGGEAVGVLLPAGCAAAVASLAVISAGGTVVALPPSRRALARAVASAGVRRVIGERSFCDRLGVTPERSGVEWCWLDPTDTSVSFGARLSAWLRARGLPLRLAERSWLDTTAGAADRAVAVLFSRGTLAEPEPSVYGPLAVHSNLRALRQVFRGGPG